MGHDNHREKQSKRQRTVHQLASEVEFRRLRVWLDGPTKDKQLANVRNDLGILEEIILENLTCALEDGQLQGWSGGGGGHVGWMVCVQRTTTCSSSLDATNKASKRSPVHHSQRLHRTSHRILQVCCKYVCIYNNRNPLSGRSDFYRILFQRGVYPADDFHMVKKYGQTVLITQDLALENYLEKYLLSPPLQRA
jgi:hypothetical protein